MVFNFLRLRQRPPGKPPPPGDRVDVFYDDATGKIAARDSRDAAVLFDGTGGSTDGLTTSNGSADAAAGKLGEYVENTLDVDTPLTSTVAANRGSITLTPGDWDVTGIAYFLYSAASGGLRGAGISMVSDSASSVGSVLATPYTTMTSSENLPVPQRRIKVTTTTTVYLVAQAVFSGGTVSATGQLTARRVR